MSTSLIYRGSVSLYADTNSGTRKLLYKHNAGTIWLSKLFAALCINSSLVQVIDGKDSLVPGYMNIETRSGKRCATYDSPIIEKTSTLENEKYITTDMGKYKIRDTNWRAVLEAKFNKSDLNASINSAIKIVLLDSYIEQSDRHILAEADFSNLNAETVGSNYIANIFDAVNNVVVVWEMELLNPEEGDWEN